MEERKSFVEKYAESKSGKNNMQKIKLPKFKIKFPKINHELIFKYFMLIVFASLISRYIQNISINSEGVNNRFEIEKSNFGMTILLDKKNGTTWRNIHCDEKTKIPNCWQEMDYNIYPAENAHSIDSIFK